MDPIGGISQIVQILRRKLGERATRPAVAAGPSAQRPGAAGPQKVGVEEIKRKIGARLEALPPAERNGARAMQVFIESIIAWEFGEQILADSKFGDLSKDVLDAIAADEQASAQLRRMLRQL